MTSTSGTFNQRISSIALLLVAFSATAMAGDIQIAARDGNIAKVKALLHKNPQLVSSTDQYGWTALLWAADKGRKEVVELLLAQNADVNARDTAGETPLQIAVLNDQMEVAELLLAAKVNVNARDQNG